MKGRLQDIAAKTPLYDVAVIGGGAAGLTAALAAAGRGARTLVLEAQPSAGKKILASGNGRCNLSNQGLTPAHYSGSDPRFAEALLELWTPRHMREFWRSLGLATRLEDDRVYPYSLQAKSVLNILLASLAQSGCTLKTSAKLSALIYRSSPQLHGAAAETERLIDLGTADGQRYRAKKVILCTGGMAAPALGSDGSAYTFYTHLGHRLIEPYPALTPLLSSAIPKRLSGIRVRADLRLKYSHGGQRRESGELLFTDYGLSGICAMNLAEAVGRAMDEGETPLLAIDLLPDLAESEALNLLETLGRREPRTPAAFWGIGLLPEKLSAVLYEQSYSALTQARGYKPRQTNSGPAEKQLGSFRREDWLRLLRLAKNWSVALNGTKGFAFAQVTAGGLATADFNPYTLESLLCPGLYAAGEVLDVHAPCGGFNLHWAFASGSAAGQHAALSLISGAPEL